METARLTKWLVQHIPNFSGPVTLTKFGTGQSNPTYSLTSPSGRYVLRRKPSGTLLKFAHAVDREFRVMKALAATNVPVPEVLALCEDESVIGAMFYIMRHVDGRIFWDPLLPDVPVPERAAYYDAMNATLAALHKVNITKAGLSDFGKSGNYFERQFIRWCEQYKASEIEPHEAMDRLMQWLEANMLADDGRSSLVHGDFRIDNMIFHPIEPHIVAVLDWELSTLGHPFADLAYQCMQWRLPYRSEIRGLGGIDREAEGLPTEQAYVAAYARRMGIGQIDNWSFYLAFSLFRFSAILQGVAKRAMQGNASNPEAGQMLGKRVPELAAMALHIIQTDGRP